MSEAALDRLVAASEALIAALDAGEVETVETATARLTAAVTAVRGAGGWRETPAVAAKLSQALRLAEAGRVRLNYLADGTRRRLEAAATLRGTASARIGYGRDGRLRGVSG